MVSQVTARTVKIEIVQIVDAQVLHGQVKVPFEFIDIGRGANFGGDVQFVSRCLFSVYV